MAVIWTAGAASIPESKHLRRLGQYLRRWSPVKAERRGRHIDSTHYAAGAQRGDLGGGVAVSGKNLVAVLAEGR